MAGMPYEGEHNISQRFGSNAAAYARWGLSGHNGLDFALPSGTPLLACVDGIISTRENDPTGYGQYTVIADDAGGQWLYGHGSRWDVRQGQLVSQGQRLGLSGNTGNSTGPHVHWAYRPPGYDRANGYAGYVNPRPFLPLPYRVALQTGHAPDGGGAPGEAAWTPRLAASLKERLTAAGVEVKVVPGFFNRTVPASVSDDADLWLSLHYDARFPDAYTTGCCAGRGEFETEPWEADRFLAVWARVYPEATGVPYAWRHLSYVTPGVLLEHGVGAPGVGGDAALLHEDLDRVADADAAAVLEYLGMTHANNMVPQGIVDELNRQIEELRSTIGAKDSELGALRVHVIEPMAAELADLRAKVAAGGVPRGIRRVEIEFDDGSTQEVAA
jgi:hypothetical protein